MIDDEPVDSTIIKCKSEARDDKRFLPLWFPLWISVLYVYSVKV